MTITPSRSSQRFKPRKSNLKNPQNWAWGLMCVPALVLLALFSYLPMAGAVIAFKNYRASQGIWGSEWVGFKNFEFLFNSGNAWRITLNTIFLNGLFIVTGLVVALALALVLYELQGSSRRAVGFYQSALFFPFFISYVIVSYFTYALFATDTGLLNAMLKSLGLAAVNWYTSSQYWTWILVLVNLWKGVGFGVVIYLAGMLAIDKGYYEAAEIDGASKWQQVRFITLPLLAPLITINLLLAVGRIFYADFGLFYFVPRDSSLLYPSTDVIDTFVFRALRSLGDFGMAGAAGLYQSVVGFVLVLFANWVVRRHDPERALF
jgi:putative aldouronate transport system permease protein